RSGISVTAADQPALVRASLRLYSAAPQHSRIAAPSGSDTRSWRLGSAYRSIPRAVRSNSHGWVLCMDGARVAASTADNEAAGLKRSVVMASTRPREAAGGQGQKAPRGRAPAPTPNNVPAVAGKGSGIGRRTANRPRPDLRPHPLLIGPSYHAVSGGSESDG